MSEQLELESDSPERRTLRDDSGEYDCDRDLIRRMFSTPGHVINVRVDMTTGEIESADSYDGPGITSHYWRDHRGHRHRQTTDKNKGTVVDVDLDLQCVVHGEEEPV